MTSLMQPMTAPGAPAADRVHDGDDFSCPNCGCEVRIRHVGDPAQIHLLQAFICRCGVAMAPERHQNGQEGKHQGS